MIIKLFFSHIDEVYGIKRLTERCGDNLDSIIFVGVIIACLVFISICVIRRRPDWIINFGLRSCIGVVAIYLLDMILKSKGYDLRVGINGATILTNGLLGLPGFIMLYGLAAYYTFG